jgi:hypothetical protein
MKKLDNKSLKILRGALPAGSFKIIKERLGEFTIDYIRKIMNGTNHNDKVIMMALAVAKEEKERKEALKKEIAELATN